MAITTFRRGPRYNTATDTEVFDKAMETPMSIGQTFGNQVLGGALESFGLGTVVRDFSIPQGTEPRQVQQPNESIIPNPIASGQRLYEDVRNWFNPVSKKPPLSEEQWKGSPFYRENIPFDPGMTEDRAAALAIWDDARKVREHFASQRPFTSFAGNLLGQAIDPINYIPVAGPAVKAAAVSKFGTVAGSIAVGALDAAVNTGVASVATMGARAQYGDDVSWQRQVSEIATAALIGSAFGAVGGVLERRGNSRAMVRAEVDAATLRTSQEARVALNEGLQGMALNDAVNIGEGAAAPIIKRVEEIQNPLPLAVPDQPRAIVTPTGQRIYAKPEIVDARTLTAATGDLQPRDRSRAASDAQIEDIALNLDPERLMFSPEADRGAPIVGPDGVVESGNGRRQAIMRAAEAYPAKFEAYRQALRDQGFDVPEDGVPMLVSRRTSELSPADRVQFVTGANTSAIARMSATEAAMTDVHAMTDNVVGAYQGGDIKAAGNRSFVSGFLDNLPQNERAALVDADGTLNADGVRRIENSLVAAAYGDPTLVARFAEATDDNAKSITGAMADASTDWLRMRRAISAGEVDAALDLTSNVLEALQLISRAREQAALQGRPVSQLVDEAVRQIDMMTGPLDPRTEAIVQAFYSPGYRRAKSRDDIGTALRLMAQEIESTGRPQLFPETVVSSTDIAQAVAVRGEPRGSRNASPSPAADREVITTRGADDRQSGFRGTSQANPRDPSAVEQPEFYEVQVTDGGAIVRFDDPYTARHFELGRALIERNGISPEDAWFGSFHSLPLGELEAEARELFSIMGPYVTRDFDGDVSNVGLFARQAVQIAAQVMDEAKARNPGQRFDTVSIIEPEEGAAWSRRVRTQMRRDRRAAADAAARNPAPPAPERTAVDLSPGTPEPPPEGLVQAASAVGKPDDMKAIATQYGVDANTGEFAEQAEIDQLIAGGRLTDADEAALTAAAQDFDQAKAYGDAMMTAARCMVG